jgi:hypothetical protein
VLKLKPSTRVRLNPILYGESLHDLDKGNAIAYEALSCA